MTKELRPLVACHRWRLRSRAGDRPRRVLTPRTINIADNHRMKRDLSQTGYVLVVVLVFVLV